MGTEIGATPMIRNTKAQKWEGLWGLGNWLQTQHHQDPYAGKTAWPAWVHGRCRLYGLQLPECYCSGWSDGGTQLGIRPSQAWLHKDTQEGWHVGAGAATGSMWLSLGTTPDIHQCLVSHVTSVMQGHVRSNVCFWLPDVVLVQLPVLFQEWLLQ